MRKEFRIKKSQQAKTGFAGKKKGKFQNDKIMKTEKDFIHNT